MPSVSIIIPTYNHGNYVLETLRSVFAQTFSDYEVIVVNDGSPDQTAQLLQPLMDEGRIRYIEQVNGGQAAARNRGLAEAKGKFIAFLDDDDLWPADKLAWQTDVLEKTNAVLVGGSVVHIREGCEGEHHPTNVIGKITKEDLAGGAQFFSPGQTLIRHEALKTVGGFDPSIWGADDYDLYLRLEQQGTLYIEDKISLFYRLHAGNASKQRHRMLINTFKVAQRHFPEARSLNSRKAYRWLYNYVGSEQIGGIKDCLRLGDIQAVCRHFKALTLFGRPAMHDLSLARKIGFDLLPRRLTKNF